jgi:hypothetical protein
MGVRARTVGWICAVLFVAIAVPVACLGILGDPGWGYRVIPGRSIQTDGHQGYYELPTVSGVSVRVNASVFTDTLDLEFDVLNNRDGSVSLDPSAVRVTDAKGAPLELYQHDAPIVLGAQAGEHVVVATGQSRKLFARFLVFRKSVDTLAVDFAGLRRGDVAVPIRFQLERI